MVRFRLATLFVLITCLGLGGARTAGAQLGLVQLPTITVNTPRDGQHVQQYSGFWSDFLCFSILGISTCEATDLDTMIAGEHTFTAHAVDRNGNQSQKVVTYFVDPYTTPASIPAVDGLYMNGIQLPDRSGAYSTSFTPPSPGKLTIRWAAGTSIRGTSPGVTVGRSSYRFVGLPGAKRVRIVMSATGRKRLMAARSRRLRIRSTTTFTPDGAKPYRRSQTITVGRRR